MSAPPLVADQPIDVEATFGFASNLPVLGFAEPTEHVPEIDPAYRFDPSVTKALLAGFVHNRRVLVQGAHGTGKSTHIEQIAARLNGHWCAQPRRTHHAARPGRPRRVVVRDGCRSPSSGRHRALVAPTSGCVVFDELDAGRPDVMFVIQRMLERGGSFTLLDQNRVLSAHPGFRIFATANTVGLGNLSGLYHGTQLLNQAQVDRGHRRPTRLPESRCRGRHRLSPRAERRCRPLGGMVAVAGMTRVGFAAGDLHGDVAAHRHQLGRERGDLR